MSLSGLLNSRRLYGSPPFVFFVSLGTVLAILCVVEGCLRFAGFRFDPYRHYKRFGANFEADEIRHYRHDPEVFWEFRPSQIVDEWWGSGARINSRGFRGRSFKWKKEPGVFRVVCLGDSGTFGWELEDHQTYSFYLERLLEEKIPDRKVEAINMGVPGYSSHQGLVLLKKHVVRMSPDVIVFCFGRNDHNDTVYLTDRQRQSYPAFWTGLQNALLRTRLYQWIYKKATLSRYKVDSHHFVILKGRQTVRVPLGDYESNLRQAARISRDMGAQLLFIPRSQWTEYNNLMKRVALEENVKYVDLGLLERDSGIQDFMKGEHPGPDVYSRLARQVTRYVN